MKIEVFDDAASTAKAAAVYIAEQARPAIAKRGRFLLGLSGGKGPLVMFRDLANMPLPWDRVHIVQVDERVAPAGDAVRNFTHLQQHLLSQVPVPAQNIHPMPVESLDLEAAANQYSATLQQIAGSPPVLDLVHLGMGDDGHTASLIPGDPVLEVKDVDVAVSGIYQGTRRMTLTYPIINRARQVLWLVTGADKAPMLPRLIQHDAAIPAGRVAATSVILFADRAANGQGQASDDKR
jgi:6-phosphogluconolactonase